jgi:hypothetical protein
MERCGSARSQSCARTSKATRKPRRRRLTLLGCRRIPAAPVGLGPSGKTWPRCASHDAQRTSVRRISHERSSCSLTAPLSSGAQKLGQPVPESNLVLDENSEVPQQTHLKRPGRFSRLRGLEKGRSVPCCRATWNCSGVSCFFHSSSLFVTVGAGSEFMSVSLGRTELSSILSGVRGGSASVPCQRAPRSGRCAKNQRAIPWGPPSRRLNR